MRRRSQKKRPDRRLNKSLYAYCTLPPAGWFGIGPFLHDDSLLAPGCDHEHLNRACIGDSHDQEVRSSQHNFLGWRHVSSTHTVPLPLEKLQLLEWHADKQRPSLQTENAHPISSLKYSAIVLAKNMAMVVHPKHGSEHAREGDEPKRPIRASFARDCALFSPIIFSALHHRDKYASRK